MTSPPLKEPEPVAAKSDSLAFLRNGFRPFYLLASVFAAVSVALWALQFSGLLARPYLSGSLWHAHEMLFGFALAVVVGFLFTAGRNWTSQPTPAGAALAAFAALWVAGRVLVLTPWGWAAAVINTAFPLAAAWALAIPLLASENRRNYFFVGLLLLLATAVAAFHLAQLQLVALPDWLGVQIGLDALLFIMSVMGGRVIPMFTNNGVPGAHATRHAVIEKIALGLVLVLLLADSLQVRGVPLAMLLVFLTAVHLARWLLWQPWTTLRTPLVWVLHLAYLWIPVHLALRCVATLGLVAPSIAIHALTVGAMGGLIIGMMTRTARGHTGRPLRADGMDVACYGLVLSAAICRVMVPLCAPAAGMYAVLGSAALWSAGFGLFAIRYWPVLTRPRIDGQPG